MSASIPNFDEWVKKRPHREPPESRLPDLLSFAEQNKLEVGSTTSGSHNRGSKHYTGNAIDIRNSGGFDDATVQRLSAAAREAGLKLRDERVRPRGQAVWNGAHVHIETADEPQIPKFDDTQVPNFDDWAKDSGQTPPPRTQTETPNPPRAASVPSYSAYDKLDGFKRTRSYGDVAQQGAEPQTVDFGNSEPVVLDPTGRGMESPRKARIRQQVTQEEVMKRRHLPLSTALDYITGNTPEKKVEERFQSEEVARAEQERLVSQFTDADRREIQDFTDHLKGKNRVYTGVRTGARSIGSSALYKLAGLFELANRIQKPVTGEGSWLPDWFRKKALAGELSVDDIPKEQRNQVAEFLTEAGLGLAEVAATPGGPIAKFGALAGTEALGRNKPTREVLARTGTGMATGGVFKGAEALAPEGASLAQRLGTTVPAVGLGTGAIELASGADPKQAALSAVTNAAFAGVGELQRYFHKDWGKVVKTESQEGARKGRTRVAEVADPEKIHYPKTADLSGRGNQRMVPVREPTVENLESGLVQPAEVPPNQPVGIPPTSAPEVAAGRAASQPRSGEIDLNAPVPVDVLRIVNRTFNQMVGPDIYSELPEKPTTQDVIELLAKVGLSDQIMQESVPALRKAGYTRIGDALITDEGLRAVPKQLSAASQPSVSPEINTEIRKGAQQLQDEARLRQMGVQDLGDVDAGVKPEAPQSVIAPEAPKPEAERLREFGATEEESKPKEPEAGAIDVDLLTLGVRPFAKEVAEKGVSALAGVREVADAVKSILAPATRGSGARITAAITRANASEMARTYDIAEKSLEGARNYFSSQKPNLNYEFIDRMERGEAQPDPKTQQFADTLRSTLDERRDQIRDLGTGKLEDFIENYFPHIWKDPKKAATTFAEIFGRRPLEGSKAFLKQRSIPFTSEGVDRGLEPVSNNPVDLTLLKLREMDKYLMAHKVMGEMKDNGLLQFVKATQRIPENYKKINDSVATVYGGPESKPQGGQLIRGYYVAPEPAAKILNNYLSPGISATALRTPYRAWRATANIMNQAQLGFSFFHGGFTTLDAVISRTAAGLEDIFRYGKPVRGIKTIASTPVSPITNLIRGSKMLQEWVKPGSQGAEIKQLVDAMVQGGGRAKMDRFYTDNAVKRFKDTLKQGNLIGAALRLPRAAIEKASYPVMEWLVPRQKAGIFAEMARREMERLGPNASREDVRTAMAKAWDSVDNRMGQMVYDNIFWNKITKDLAMASVRSVGWNLGTAREVGGGIVDFATLPKRALQKGRTEPLFTHKMAYASALPLVVGMAGAMTQYLLTGKGPDELKDYFFPKTGLKDENGNDERIALPSYMKDIFHFKEEPGKVVTSKLHPLISTVAEMLSNRDYYGTKIRNEDDPYVQQLKEVATHIGKSFVPFSVRGYQKESERDASLRRKLLPFIGITPAPSYINKTPAEKLMSKITEEQMPAGTRTKEQTERSRLRHKLEQWVRSGRDVTKEVESGVQQSILKPDDLAGILRDAQQSPLQLRFKHLGIKNALDVYDKMNEGERAQVKEVMEAKGDLIANLPLDEQEPVTKRMTAHGFTVTLQPASPPKPAAPPKPKSPRKP